jgi:quercetin dioxygenase-like cupin family protein
MKRGQIMVEELIVLSDRVRVLTHGGMTEGRYEVFEVHGAAGGGAPLHSHAWDEEFHVVQGEVDVVFQDRTHRCKAGDSLRVAAGTVHGFKVGTEGAKFLAFTSPQGASELFRALDRERRVAPLTPEKVVQIAAACGVKVPGASPVHV